MTPTEIVDALKSAFGALAQIRNLEGGPEAPTVEVAAETAEESGTPDKLAALRAKPKRSIRRNKVVCLECGMEFKQLTNGHLKEHGMTAREYRRKYGFMARQPLSSQELSEKRRKNAEEKGLGEKLKEARKKKASEAGVAAPKKVIRRKKAE